MKRAKGTLGQRKRALMEFIERLQPGDFLQYIAGRFGKDALMSAALETTGLDKRPLTEKLAEIAFDLVPGQIEQVYKGYSAIFYVPRRPEINLNWIILEF